MLLCKILVQRDIDTFEKAKDYFGHNFHNFTIHFLMKDMDKAVERILSAINNKEKILSLWRL